jgi:predicted AlkP superfamily phosphohydrolase/phosphomutase
VNRHNSPRQLLIGLDAMDWHLVRKWAAENKMPTFRRLMEEGTQAELSTVADTLPDTSWNCICSGLNPAHLARYFYVQHDPETAGLRYMPDDSSGVNYFWDHLSAAGRRVGVVDVPHVDIAPRLNGFQLVSWGTHASHSSRSSTLPSMLREVDARFGRHPVGECDAVTSAPEAKKELRRRLLAGVRAHGELFRYCITEQDWEVLTTVFAAPHCAGHFFWHYLDPTHPLHDPDDRHGLADTIETVYRAIDREVGAMIEAAGVGVRVYAFAAHGMGPLYHASWNLPEILDYLGYGNGGRRDHPRVHPDGTRPGAIHRANVNYWRILRMMMPGKLQYAIKAVLPERLQHELMFRFYGGNRSWEKCRAFAVPNNDAVGAIRINLKGRDYNGLVEPGAEYDRICDDLCAALAELSDPISGRPVVKYISRIQRELHGPRVDKLPDITANWEQSFPWSSVYSPRFGTVRLRNQDSRTGSHSPHAFMLASGEGIPRGAAISGASIFDFVPTILYGAGMRAPTNCEGHPLFPASCAHS